MKSQNELIDEKKSASFLSVLIFSIPLVSTILILILDWKETFLNPLGFILLGVFLLIYTGLLIAYYRESKSRSSKQGYSLLGFLILFIVFLVFYAELIQHDLNPVYSTFDTFISTILLINGFIPLAFFIYAASYVVQVFLVKLFGLLHQTTIELRNNTAVRVKIDLNENEVIEDFGFSAFNRYLKVHLLWAIIPLVSFPFSIDFLNLSDINEFSSLLVSIIFLIVILSVTFAVIHYRNFKNRITFILSEDPNIINGSQEKIQTQKFFADDLLSFMKIGLLIGFTGRILDLINFFNSVENNFDFLLLTLSSGCFFSSIYFTEVIYLFLLQYCQNYLARNEKIQILLTKLKQTIKWLPSKTKGIFENLLNTIDEYRLLCKQNTRNKIGRVKYFGIYILTFLLEATISYLGVLSLVIEFSLICIIIGILFVPLIYIVLVSLPIAVFGSGIIYWSSRNERSISDT